jgi:TatD DNase family protein
MLLTDTHTHLYSEAFDEDRSVEIEKAIKAGIGRFFLPAIDSTYYPSMKELKEEFPNEVYLMAGLHPTHVKENVEEELSVVKRELQTGNYCAVGEIGIDLYWDKTFLKQQQNAFAIQINWARDYDLPFAIHCRDAFDEVFEVLETLKGPFNGIFHCFTGTFEQAQRAIDLGLKLGIGGVVTFKNGKIDQFLNEIPLEHIVLETDAPYLAPVPYRGKRNNPEYLRIIADKLAEIHKVSLEDLARITTSNAEELFKI